MPIRLVGAPPGKQSKRDCYDADKEHEQGGGVEPGDKWRRKCKENPGDARRLSRLIQIPACRGFAELASASSHPRAWGAAPRPEPHSYHARR